MFFVIREIAGWLLLFLGLGLVGLSLSFLGDRQVVEAGVAVVAATLIFRGGILLIRVSTAARICLQSQVTGAETPTTASREAKAN